MVLSRDLHELGRRLSTACRLFAETRRAMHAAPSDFVEGDAFRGIALDIREVMGKTLFDTISGTPTEVAAFKRWIAHLTISRVAFTHEARTREAISRATVEVVLEEPRRLAFEDAWRSFLFADKDVLALRLAAALDAVAAPIGAAQRAEREVCTEAAARLGLPHPLALSLPCSAQQACATAHALLDATTDIATEITRMVRSKSSEQPSVFAMIRWAQFRDAEGFPGAIERFVEETSALLRGRIRPASRSPSTSAATSVGAPGVSNGAMSVARALYLRGVSFQYAVADEPALVPGDALTFAELRSPLPLRASRLGAIFASVLAAAPFHTRVLGLGKGRGADQSRGMTLRFVFAMRALAAKVLIELGSGSADERRELSERVFGLPLPPQLGGVWPFRSHANDDYAQFFAALRALVVVTELRDRFDEDWFQNPRVARALQGEAFGPQHEMYTEVELQNAVSLLARSGALAL